MIKFIYMERYTHMAPQSGLQSIAVGKTWILIAIIAAAVAWMWLSNMPPAQPPQTATPRVVKINATTPPQPTPQLQTVGLFMCREEAYRTRTGVIICGVEMVTDQYIFLRRGWIYAANATFTLLGDVSVCKFSVSVHTLYVDCAQPIMVVK
jgi:uncharacterized membrane protein YagU involved in acid resistance